MKFFLTCLINLTIITLHARSQFIDANKNGKMDIYENPKADIEERIIDLLSQMNLDEKIAQITSVAEIQLDNQKGNESQRLPGKEVVQMYIGDNYSTVSRPVIELKGFKKVALKAGESKQVVFETTPDKLKFYNSEMKEVAEPGEFTV